MIDAGVSGWGFEGAVTDLVVWLRQQLDTDEQVALAAAEVREGARAWRFRVAMDLHTGPEYELHMGQRVVHAGMPGDEDEPLRRPEIQHMAAHDPARVLRQVQAHRAILDEYEHQLAKKAENSAKFVAMTKSASLDQQEFTNVKTHGWELSGRVDALKFAVEALLAIYSDRDGYRAEWSA